jgi:hypothetical protein
VEIRDSKKVKVFKTLEDFAEGAKSSIIITNEADLKTALKDLL